MTRSSCRASDSASPPTPAVGDQPLSCQMMLRVALPPSSRSIQSALFPSASPPPPHLSSHKFMHLRKKGTLSYQRDSDSLFQHHKSPCAEISPARPVVCLTHYRGRQLIRSQMLQIFFSSVLSHNGTEALAQPTRGDKRRSVLLNLGLSNHHFLIHGQKAAQGVTTHYTHSHGKTKKSCSAPTSI